jgi:signal transduction histidine kinase
MDKSTVSTIKLSISILVVMFFTMIWHTLTTNAIFDIIVNIREAITSGDSGLLIITMNTACFLFMIPSISFYLSLDIFYTELFTYLKRFVSRDMFIVVGYSLLIGITQLYDYYPIEIGSSFIGLCITLVLVYFSTCRPFILMPKFFIALQVYLFVQWMNVMQVFTDVSVGSNDVFVSLKIAASYLDKLSNVNKITLYFMMPLLISSFVTAFIIKLYNQNLQVAEENFQHELAVKAMQKNMMKNRTYQEINALAHDLKTPLVTVQGLSSLLSITKDIDKVGSYGERIDEATGKMSDMISSFLYGNMKETIEISTLLEYIRSQVPVEAENIHFNVSVAAQLPPLYINKVRMARALINLIENAILAPLTGDTKNIEFWADVVEDDLIIRIRDDGIGIQAEALEDIWMIGYSSKATSGLGLPFAKQTIEENGGSIQIESTYGEGTVVTIRFPLGQMKEGSEFHGNN